MDSESRDLDLLLLAVQHGLLSDAQVDAFLKEGGLQGSITEQRLREQAARREKPDPMATAIRVDVLMSCRACGLDQPLTLESALRKPKCPSCSGALKFRRQLGGTGVRPAGAPLPDEVKEAAGDPKNRFGKYWLLRKIGAGGMGEVFRAFDTVLGRFVALKFPRTMSEDDVRRLYLEAQGAGGLAHPNIASIFEVAEAEGRHYIAMQYIDGKTADPEPGARTDPREIARWMRDAARGLNYAHERGVIHRDIKPSNLMIDVDQRVYIMDFGLAKLLGGAGGGTISGVILGTPAFMPPEQAAGNANQIDRRSDIYSLGATLYTLLAGRRPFDGDSATDILVKILTTEPPPLRSVRPDVPWELEAVVERAMARARDQRYEQAKDFADDLDRFLANEPVKARRSTLTRRIYKRYVRNKGPIFAAAAAALLIGGLALLAGAFRKPAPENRLGEWTALLDSLRGVITVDRFDPARAAPLLARIEREFPDQKPAADALLADEGRALARWLEGLPRSEWLASRDRVGRALAWLEFAKQPADAARRILAWRGTCTLLVHVAPYAELSGPWAAALPAAERRSPLALRDVEIVDGPLALSHPESGRQKSLSLPPLRPGVLLRIEGSWERPDSIQVKEGP